MPDNNDSKEGKELSAVLEEPLRVADVSRTAEAVETEGAIAWVADSQVDRGLLKKGIWREGSSITSRSPDGGTVTNLIGPTAQGEGRSGCR